MKIKEDFKVTKSISALMARTQLGQILERVSENKERFLVSKRGKGKAVIMGLEDYLRNIVKQPEALTRLQKQAEKTGANKLTLEEIDQEIKAFRSGQ